MFQLRGCTAVARRELGSGDPIAIFERLRSHPYPWLLDSSLPSERLGRHSFAGADPYWVLRARGDRVELEVRRRARPGHGGRSARLRGDPFEIVRALLPAPPEEVGEPLPFIGGAVGYLGYELAEHLEPLTLGGFDDLGVPDLALLFVDRLVGFDHATGRLAAFALGFGEGEGEARRQAERSLDAFCATLASSRPPARAPRGRAEAPRPPFAFFDADAYAKAVEIAKREIAVGNVYQACLTHRLERDAGGDPWDLYRRLRRLNPAPFASYLELPELAILGSSPERFLRLWPDRRVESRPIKGTRPRGRDPREDAALRAALAASAKDRAENLMIVDLVRNDLGRVCETGSVEVPELMAVEAYASVFQMVSGVCGRLRADRDAVDLVRASFPPGSMTGAPKIAAMRLLSRLEPVRRGVYSGAIGYFDARGGIDLCVVIRTLLVRDGRAYAHTGGGIVADSDPLDEYRETLHKARPLLEALSGC